MANIEKKPGETNEAYLRRISKIADQRLIRLEQLAGTKGYEKVLNWSYAKARQNTRRWGGQEGKPRFNKNQPTDPNEIRSKIKDIEEFLGSASSQKSSITKFYKERANSLNKSQGTNLTWQDLANFFENTKNESNLTKYGSGDVFRAYSATKNKEVTVNVSEKELVKAIKSDRDLTEIIQVEDENVKDTIIEMLKANDLDTKYLFPKD